MLFLLYPASCVACFKDGDVLCQKCEEEILKAAKYRFYCSGCGKEKDKIINFKCCEGGSLDLGIALFKYEKNGTLSKMLHNLKYKGFDAFSENILKIIEESASKLNLEKAVITPLPLHLKKFKKRGFNQVDRLFVKFLENREDLVEIGLIKKIKNNKAQAECNENQRKRNAINTFLVDKVLVKKLLEKGIERIIVLDDVATTYSTLNEVSRILKKEGIKEVFGMTLMKT